MQNRRPETRRSAAKYTPYTLAYDDEEFSLESDKRSSRPTVSRTVSTTSTDRKKPKTTSEPLPPPTTNLGMPTPAQYKAIEEEYIHSLHPRKREKALLSQAMFDMVWDVLHDPLRSRVGSPQFRWWVRKMFVLSYDSAEGESGGEAGLPVVLHEDRPVALKEQIYEVLCYCHDRSNHGGRDKTTMVIRDHYSWIPKELVAQFVKACPTCVYKKTGSRDLAHALADVANNQLSKMEREEARFRRDSVGTQEPPAIYPRLPVMPEPTSVPVLVKTESEERMPSPDWSTAGLPLLHAPQAPPSYLAPSSCGPQVDWSTGVAPSHIVPAPAYLGQLQDLPSVRRMHSSDDAFAYNDQSRVTLPPLQKVLSDSGFRLGQPSTWLSAPVMPPQSWDSSPSAWTVPAFQVPLDMDTQTSLTFASDSPLSSPTRRWYHSLGVHTNEDIEEQLHLNIDPALLGPSDDYISMGDEAGPPSAVGTPHRMRRMLSVQSLIVGSASMTSLTLHAEFEDGQEVGTPVRRAVAGVLANGRSPGGSVYLHPSSFMLSE
ncbi:hypothetical protein C8Q72DRAFT_973141 [Fomitopsis betulina]|nr:hypothetical protein C8Q72DRAFT_973141 [Fomitopsis betulina]